MPTANQLVADLDLPIPLMSGGQATLRIPRPMSEEDYDYMTTMLTGMLTGMRKAIITQPVKAETPQGYDVDLNDGRES